MHPNSNTPIMDDPRDPPMRPRADVVPIFGPALTMQPAKPERTDATRLEELELLAAMDVLRDLVKTYTGPRITTWVRNLAAVEGQSVHTLPLDGNGLPVGHEAAVFRAQEELSEWVDELPESFYHLSRTDAEDAVRRVVGRYLLTLTRGTK